MDRSEQLKTVFEDTQRFYTEDPCLAAAIEESREGTKLYTADECIALPILGTYESYMLVAEHGGGSISAEGYAAQLAKRIEEGEECVPYKDGAVSITKARTFEAAIRLHKEYPDKKIAVLNFASATRPGGGVKNGSSAQEEALCRCSTLYPTLDRRFLWQQYYDVNRAANDVRHTDACIYSPNVVICKTDDSLPTRMPQKDWVNVDVISCAAPNLRKNPSNRHNPEGGSAIQMSDTALYELHMKRAQRIMTVAALNKVDILVLGAFGCGAFCNDPSIVAKAYYGALSSMRRRFDLIEFAIYGGSSANYDAFKRVLGILETKE